jgi:dihydrofolate synthase/folylpolyglutamate synthase
MDLGLDRVAAVWQRLGGERPAPVVLTVGGTNGKGSCVALLEAILRAAGYRVGCYTSPHLVRYVERVRIAGEAVAEDVLLEALQRVAAVRADTPLTYFEYGTLAALLCFRREPLDVVVLEVGLGGRLDAVNIIDADAALVAAVGLDHQDWLGPDRESIAFEKAGIYRAGRPAICADPEPPASLVAHADRLGADLRVPGRDFGFRAGDGTWEWHGRAEVRRALPLPALRGRHQLRNAAGVLAMLEAVVDVAPVDQRAVREGLLSARLAGRFDVRRVGETTWILDVAHNPQAAEALALNLGAEFVPGRTRAVLAMLAGKDVAGLVQALDARIDAWYLAAFEDPRALSAQALAAAVREAAPAAEMRVHATLPEALEAVGAASGAGDRVVVLGSFITVGEAMTWLDGA